jgi:DNA polymerase elongation subunit (family B)
MARKRELAAATGEIDRSRLDAMQSSMKILINSFYGYLGYARGIFNDYAAADRVTTGGQEILRTMMGEIRSSGGRVVEVDTDGVYFVPPDDVRGEEQEEGYVRKISRALPKGISLAMAGRYRKMLSYRKKNYALLTYDNRIRIKGSSLISRAMERFGRTFVQQCIDYLLNGYVEGLHTLYVQMKASILERKLEARDFGRLETLRETLEEYGEQVRRGKRNRSAAYEVALASGKPFKAGDRVAYYIAGTDPNPKGFENCKPLEDWDPNFPDENTSYYLRRLDELSSKFEDFFLPQDFRSIFSSDDLFQFDPRGVTILNLEPRGDDSAGKDAVPPPQLGIWLDEG